MTDFHPDDILRKKIERLVQQQLISLTQYLENLHIQKSGYEDEITEIVERIEQYTKSKLDCEMILERLEYERQLGH